MSDLSLLFKTNLIGTNFYVQNILFFSGLYRLKLTKISYIVTLFNVQFMILVYSEFILDRFHCINWPYFTTELQISCVFVFFTL